MYFVPPSDASPLRPVFALRLALCLCAAATLVLGLYPGPVLSLVSRSAVVNLL